MTSVASAAADPKWLATVPGATSARRAMSSIVVAETPCSWYSSRAAAMIRRRVSACCSARFPSSYFLGNRMSLQLY